MKKDDLELLKLAARALNYVLDADGDRLDVRAPSGAPLPWNPLEDGRDTIALEEELKLSVFWSSFYNNWVVEVAGRKNSLAMNHDRKRASVLAAAKIGKEICDDTTF